MDDAEIDDLGWTDYLESDGVLAIEWPEKVRKMLPIPRIEVYLSYLGETNRKVEIVAIDDARD